MQFIDFSLSRWWSQFESLAWPEDLLSGLCLIMQGHDERSVKRRHTIARYLNLTSALAWWVFRRLIKKCFFPLNDHTGCNLQLVGFWTSISRYRDIIELKNSGNKGCRAKVRWTDHAHCHAFPTPSLICSYDFRCVLNYLSHFLGKIIKEIYK